MQLSHSRNFLSLAAVGIVVLTATTAHAQFTFTNIVDTTTASPAGGTYTGFNFTSRISGTNVAFLGNYTGGAGTSGIFSSSGGAITTVATGGAGASAQAPGGGTYSSFGLPTISGNTVAFRGVYTGGTGTDGIFTGWGGALTAIATGGTGANAQVPGGGTFVDFSQTASSGANVAFFANYTGGTGSPGIFSGSGGALTSIVRGGAGSSAIAPGGGTFTAFGLSGMSGNTVAFRGIYTGGAGTQGIFSGSGGALTAIATGGTGANSQVPGGGTFTSFTNPSISGANVAFVGNYTGGTGSNGIFIGSGGALTTIATQGASAPGGGTFNGFTNPSISGSNIAFTASYAGGTGNLGLFFGNGGSLTKVISNADSLFGSTVTSVSFNSSSGLDGATMVFNYSLADGRSGIATASLAVPEPGTFALLALGLPLLLVRRRQEANLPRLASPRA